MGALAAGAKAALQDTASAVVKDAYAGLKGIIVRKFGDKPSLDSLEAKPASAAKQAAAAEDLTEAGAADDADVMAHAKALVEAVERHAPESARAIGVDLAGIKAQFLTVGHITSEGTGARLRNSEFSGGITIGNVTAGATKPDDPPRDP